MIIANRRSLTLILLGLALVCLSSLQTFGEEEVPIEETRKAAEQGDVMAQAELPASYQSGEGEKEDRKTAAGFYYQLAVFHVKAGNREAAEEASPNAGTAWKGIRLALLDDPVLAEVIF